MAGVVVGGLLVARLGGIARPASTQNLKAASKPRTSRWNSGAGAMGARASSDAADLKLSDGCKGAPLQPGTKLPIPGTEEMMSQKAHGTTDKPVQESLRWSCDRKVADKICSFNRHYAEFAGYWQQTTFLSETDPNTITTFYDSVTGLPLFNAPVGRSFEEFKKESLSHGWPSFRDEEVNWDHVRVLQDGEAISSAGTHLGHNLPDGRGNRYCINLVSVAGQPTEN